MADPLNDLVATAVRAWASLAGASIETANAVLIGLMELADTESGQFDSRSIAILAVVIARDRRSVSATRRPSWSPRSPRPAP